MVRDEATTTWVDVMMRRLGLRKLALIFCSSSNSRRDLAGIWLLVRLTPPTDRLGPL
jgi:hypothetical protein